MLIGTTNPFFLKVRSSPRVALFPSLIPLACCVEQALALWPNVLSLGAPGKARPILVKQADHTSASLLLLLLSPVVLLQSPSSIKPAQSTHRQLVAEARLLVSRLPTRLPGQTSSCQPLATMYCRAVQLIGSHADCAEWSANLVVCFPRRSRNRKPRRW